MANQRRHPSIAIHSSVEAILSEVIFKFGQFLSFTCTRLKSLSLPFFVLLVLNI